MQFFSRPYGVLITTLFWLKGVHLQPPQTQGVPPKTLLCFKYFSKSQHGWFSGNSFVLRVSFRSHTRDPLRTPEINERWTFRIAGTPLTQRTIKSLPQTSEEALLLVPCGHVINWSLVECSWFYFLFFPAMVTRLMVLMHIFSSSLWFTAGGEMINQSRS